MILQRFFQKMKLIGPIQWPRYPLQIFLLLNVRCSYFSCSRLSRWYTGLKTRSNRRAARQFVSVGHERWGKTAVKQCSRNAGYLPDRHSGPPLQGGLTTTCSVSVRIQLCRWLYVRVSLSMPLEDNICWIPKPRQKTSCCRWNKDSVGSRFNIDRY